MTYSEAFTSLSLFQIHSTTKLKQEEKWKRWQETDGLMPTLGVGSNTRKRRDGKQSIIPKFEEKQNNKTSCVSSRNFHRKRKKVTSCMQMQMQWWNIPEKNIINPTNFILKSKSSTMDKRWRYSLTRTETWGSIHK